MAFSNINLSGIDSPYGKVIEVAIAEIVGAQPLDQFSGRCTFEGRPACVVRAPYCSESVGIPRHFIKAKLLLIIAWEMGWYCYNVFKIDWIRVLEYENSLTERCPDGVEISYTELSKMAGFIQNVSADFCSSREALERWAKLTGQQIADFTKG
jgi:hypothetical protein